jgi:hypothetical protein
MQIRYVAVCDKLGRRLKIYPIELVSYGDRSPEADIASEALKRAKADRLVPEGELDSLTARVPEKVKLWR